jgi:hypothetical protein
MLSKTGSYHASTTMSAVRQICSSFHARERLFMLLRNNCVQFLIACATAASTTAHALDDNTLDFLTPPSLSGDLETLYAISIGEIPVGVAAVASENKSIGATEMDMRILLRVGSTPLVLQMTSQLQKNEIQVTGEYTFQKDKFGKKTWVWRVLENEITLQGEPSSLNTFLLGAPTQPEVKPLSRTSHTAFLPFAVAADSKKEGHFFSTITGTLFSKTEIKAEFQDNPVPKSFSIPLPEGITLDFERKEKSQVKTFLEEVRRSAIDPSWFSSEKTLGNHVNELQLATQQCLSYGENTEKNIKKKSPGIPYLLHRKIVNYVSLCRRLHSSISSWESKQHSRERFFESIAESFKSLEKEPRRELPNTLATSPELTVFRRSALQWQFVRSATYLLRKTLFEVITLNNIEQERKTNLELTIQAAQQEPRAVLRANLRSKASNLRIGLEAVKENDASKRDSRLSLDGKSFSLSATPTNDVRTICLQNQGAVTLDLSDRDNFIIRSDVARGIWDDSTRLTILSEFLTQVSTLPECSHASARIPVRLDRSAKNVVEVFRHDVLQTENEFQISNGKTTRLKTFPGTYELTLTSFVSGKLIGKQEIVVDEKSSSKLKLLFK